MSFISKGQELQYETKKDIQYYSDSINQLDKYINERCVLDIYYPKELIGYATVVWFHGGGLSSRSKEIPLELKNKGVAVVGVNYRLFPKIGVPKYIDDAAASVAWVFNNIADFGGDPSLIFLSGHSAGGYLASMVGMDKNYLAQIT